jgi:hypothetical protein
MTRPALVIAVTLAHLVAAALLLIRMVVVALATRSPELTAEAVRTIWIQTGVLAFPALLLLVGVAGLGQGRRWGWQSAAAGDLVLLALVAGDWLLGGQRVDHLPVILLLLVLLLSLMIPPVRALVAPSPRRAGEGSGASEGGEGPGP